MEVGFTVFLTVTDDAWANQDEGDEALLPEPPKGLLPDVHSGHSLGRSEEVHGLATGQAFSSLAYQSRHRWASSRYPAHTP